MARGSRGPAGYPDWQRQQNAISPTLAKQTASFREGVVTVGPLYVGNFSSLTGILFYGGEGQAVGQIRVTMRWFTDRMLNEQSGQVQFILTEFTQPHLYQFLMPNQGAWAEIISEGLGEGGRYILGWNIAATNREQLNVNPVSKPVLLTKEAKLKPGEANNWVPNYDFAGPVLVSYRANKTNNLLHLVSFNVTFGNAEALTSHQVTEAGVYEEFTWLAPLGSWEVQAVNQSGEESEYALQITPAVSGSG